MQRNLLACCVILLCLGTALTESVQAQPLEERIRDHHRTYLPGVMDHSPRS